ncbi:MAG: hydroxyphenylacetyl-CoA thioesterase PaaI [Candidatus Dormiibacterota bacterium]
MPSSQPPQPRPTTAPPAQEPHVGRDLAERCAEEMFRADRATRELGMVIEDVGPGRSRLRMVVSGSMINGHGICHGGYLFTLADSAFAFACNTYGEKVLAFGADIVFLSPAHLDDELVAVAEERVLDGRNGIYDVTVTQRPTGRVVAEFRGRSRIAGPVAPHRRPIPSASE